MDGIQKKKQNDFYIIQQGIYQEKDLDALCAHFDELFKATETGI